MSSEFRKHAATGSATILATLLAALVSSTGAFASIVDPELTSAINRLEDVAKRFEFDGRRLAGNEYLAGFERVTNTDVCGSVAVTLTADAKATVNAAVGGGIGIDPSFKKKIDVALNGEGKVSADAMINGYGTGYLMACFDFSAWALAAFYRDKHGRLPPFEAFTYEEYDAAIGLAQSEPVGSGKPVQARTAGEPFDDSGALSGLSPDANAFLDTALAVLFGESGAPETFDDTPLYRDIIEPIDGFVDSFESRVLPYASDGVLSNVGVIETAVVEARQIFIDGGVIAVAGSGAAGLVEQLASSFTDVMPFDLDLGGVVNSLRGVSVADFDACTLGDDSNPGFVASVMPRFIKDGIDFACNDVAFDAVLSYSDYFDFEAALSTLEGVVHQLEGAHDVLVTVFEGTDQLAAMVSELRVDVGFKSTPGVPGYCDPVMGCMGTGEYHIGSLFDRVMEILGKIQEGVSKLTGSVSI